MNKRTLTIDLANQLAALPLSCIQTEFPNKLSQTLGSEVDLRGPRELHPAFYGCFDWHSAVHGHWSLVKLLRLFPDLNRADEIKSLLVNNLNAAKILEEVAYFKGEHNQSFERTYGWAWLLKLAEELILWDDPLSDELSSNLMPLTGLISQKYIQFLPKLIYPIRVGTHTNTAFGLSFAYDFAVSASNVDLQNAIELKSKEFFLKDVGCPFDWEPSGYDFLSPCFEEIDLMSKVLNEQQFKSWMQGFAPKVLSSNFDLAVGQVGDRSDGHLVHLDGLNFSRAWVLYGLADKYPEYKHLTVLANKHVDYSLPNLIDDGYEGGHWLGSFAIYALN